MGKKVKTPGKIKNATWTKSKQIKHQKGDKHTQIHWVGEKSQIVKSYANGNFSRLEEKKFNEYPQKKLTQKALEILLCQSPTLREIIMAYKIASKIYSVWSGIQNDPESRMNIAIGIIDVGAKTILLDSTKGEILLVSNSL